MSTSASSASGDDAALLGDRRAPSKGERQRRAILDCLPELLSRRPIGELTVGEIAAAAGVRRSGFYFYFESKYAPLAVITAEIWTELMSRAQYFARGADESVRDFIARTGDIALGLWRDHEGVLTASVQAIPLDEQMATLWDEWNQQLADVIANQVIEDQKKGVAHPVSDDVRGLITMLLEMTMHVFYMDRLRKNEPEQTHATRDMVLAIWLASGWGIPNAP